MNIYESRLWGRGLAPLGVLLTLLALGALLRACAPAPAHTQAAPAVRAAQGHLSTCLQTDSHAGCTLKVHTFYDAWGRHCTVVAKYGFAEPALQCDQRVSREYRGGR